MGERLTTAPTTIKFAKKWNANTHRRLPAIQGALWAVRAMRGSDVVGVAIVARPARAIDDGSVLVVARVACLEDDESESKNKGACSILYAACARAARGMGASDLLTYTHLDEPGISLNAAGWLRCGLSKGGEHSRKSRPRRAAVDAKPKQRWCAPWSRRIKPRTDQSTTKEGE